MMKTMLKKKSKIQLESDDDSSVVITRKTSRTKDKPIRITRSDSLPEIKYTRCNYRLQLNIFLEGKDLIGVVRHPFGNDMAAASSIRRLTTRDPDFYGKVKSCTRGGKVFVLKIM